MSRIYSKDKKMVDAYDSIYESENAYRLKLTKKLRKQAIKENRRFKHKDFV